jgi:serine/threonine-protein kinase
VTPDPRVGTTVAGCRITSVIGRGGMGVVYLAEHLHLGRKVALKLLAPALASDERFRERFVRESRIAATIDHPNVIPVYDAGEADGVLYIAMRHVEGTDLKVLLARDAPLELERTIRLVEQIGAALDAAHGAGLVHRDVKPANVLIGSGDHCWLTDFGLTKRAGSESALTTTGVIVGTTAYMAPEQFEGREVDARADVYSLGCVVYECLTATIPFERDTQAAMMYAHLTEPPPRPSARRPDLPAAADGVVARAMAKRRDDRYQTAGELAAALRASPAVRTAPRRRRGQVVGAIAIVAALAIVTAAAIAFVTGRSGTPSSPRPGPIVAGEGAEPRPGVVAGEGFVTYITSRPRRLYRIRAQDGAQPEPLEATSLGNGTDEWIVPSQDGKWLLLSAARGECRAWGCLAVAASDVRTAQLVTVGGETQHGVYGAIASTGDRIVYVSEEGPHENDLWSSVRAGREWSAPVLLTRASRHPFNVWPSFSADAAHVVFECGPGSGPGAAVCEVAADGTGLREVIGPLGGPGGTAKNTLGRPDYAPDGGIVFAADWGRIGEQLWKLSSASRQPVRLTRSGPGTSPCVLSDGRIVTLRSGADASEIAVTAPDGARTATLATVRDVLPALGCA